MLTGFGIFANMCFYQAFLTGIYNYRTRELVNMRYVPFLLKFGVSSVVSGSLCYILYHDHLYEEEIYKVALKYRAEYDSRFEVEG